MGRGIATLQLNTTKYMEQGEQTQIQLRRALAEVLRTSLRLKLRVNF